MGESGWYRNLESSPHTEKGILSGRTDGDSDSIEGLTCERPLRASRRPRHFYSQHRPRQGSPTAPQPQSPALHHHNLLLEIVKEEIRDFS